MDHVQNFRKLLFDPFENNIIIHKRALERHLYSDDLKSIFFDNIFKLQKELFKAASPDNIIYLFAYGLDKSYEAYGKYISNDTDKICNYFFDSIKKITQALEPLRTHVIYELEHYWGNRIAAELLRTLKYISSAMAGNFDLLAFFKLLAGSNNSKNKIFFAKCSELTIKFMNIRLVSH